MLPVDDWLFMSDALLRVVPEGAPAVVPAVVPPVVLRFGMVEAPPVVLVWPPPLVSLLVDEEVPALPADDDDVPPPVAPVPAPELAPVPWALAKPNTANAAIEARDITIDFVERTVFLLKRVVEYPFPMDRDAGDLATCAPRSRVRNAKRMCA